MTIIKAHVKPVPHGNDGVQRTAQDIGVEGIVRAEGLGDSGSDLNHPDLIALDFVAPDHEWPQTLHESILDSRINAFLDRDLFVAGSRANTHVVDSRCTQSADNAGAVEIDETVVR